MKLKLDENLGKRGAAALRRAGHDVATLREQGLLGVKDAPLAALCQQEGRALVTLDLEFANPLRYDPSAHSGFAVLRLPPRPILQDLNEAIDTLVAALETGPLEGRLWIVERGRIREYQQERGDSDDE